MLSGCPKPDHCHIGGRHGGVCLGALEAGDALSAGTGVTAVVDAHAVAEEPAVGAPETDRTSLAILADDAVVAAHRPRALAGVASLVEPAGAREWGAALAAVIARCVFNEAAESVAVGTVAAILVEEHPAGALEAVLSVLAGAMLADLAVGNGGVSLGRTLAAVVD